LAIVAITHYVHCEHFVKSSYPSQVEKNIQLLLHLYGLLQPFTSGFNNSKSKPGNIDIAIIYIYIYIREFQLFY